MPEARPIPRIPLRLLAAIVVLAFLVSGCAIFNRPPVPSFTRTPSAGDAPLAVYFRATDSVDPDGVIVSYAWDFGDGTTGSGPTATHAYESAGTFQATLTVTDDRGRAESVVRAIVVSDPAGNPPEEGAGVGQRAPDFTLRDLGGSEVALSDFRGFVVLLDFWRSTCPPCQLTMPHLESLRAKYADQGLVLVGVSLDASEEEARVYVEENGFDDLIVLYGSLAEAEAVRDLYGVGGIPHTFLIDRQGIVRHADHPIRLRDYHIEPWL
jgi:peroxiredoxin